MISILIPTYNYTVFPLVENLHSQCENADLIYEILVLDDASTDKNTSEENSKINELTNSNFEILQKNIGRSKIRNLLAEKAKYDWLLFLDADTFPSSSEFIINYIKSINSENAIVYGGINYPENTSEAFSLRHTYGIERESLSLRERLKNPYRSFITMGFAIKKEVFQSIKFNENLRGYGYEDSVFAYELQKKKIPLLHIDNPVIHLNLESTDDFIKKSELALQNLLDFYKTGAIDGETVKILSIYLKLKNLGLLFSVRWFFSLSKNIILKNIRSSKPSLFLFDLYRLGYLSTLKEQHA